MIGCRCLDADRGRHDVSCRLGDDGWWEYPVPHPRVPRPGRRVCESCGREHVTGAGSLCEWCDDFVRGAYRDWLES